MAVLFTMLVLVIGYYYAKNIPAEKINLRRSAGWETYVYLGFHGLRFLIMAIFIALIMWLIAYAVLWVIGWLFSLSLPVYMQRIVTHVLFDEIQVYHVIITAFTWALCQGEIRNKKEQGNKLILENIRNYDSLLQLIIEAAADQKVLRFSLKSRKVYVGLVLAEQFETGDLDCVLIIPLLSGYRDKDTLDIFFDCNYASVYEKYSLFSAENTNESDRLMKIEDFRLAVRVNEIESVSFFDFHLFDDFERYEKPKDNNHTIENTTKEL